jgi:glycerol uptake facilitator-like aquaporin
MVTATVQEGIRFGTDLVSYIPPGFFLALFTAFIEGGKYLAAFRHEFIGTLLMIVCTFSAGKWVGSQSMRLAWTSHLFGVIAADYLGGGPNVNPAVTVSMWSLGKLPYTEAYVRIAGQLAGGLVAFPIFHAIADAMELPPFGGPEFNMEDEHAPAKAFLSEFFAMMLLMFAIYILNWELHFGSNHYIIKQTLTAVAIRALIEAFPTAGPAMNPMLATTWSVFGVGKRYEYPSDFEHYFVYWVAPCTAGIVAAVFYGIWNGDLIFGMKLPLGPLKSKPEAVAAAASKSKKE